MQEGGRDKTGGKIMGDKRGDGGEEGLGKQWGQLKQSKVQPDLSPGDKVSP